MKTTCILHSSISEIAKVRLLTIEGAKALDPVTVLVEDHQPGKGALTVRCYNRAWTAYWGAMGPTNSMASFIRGMLDPHYLTANLVRGMGSVISNRAVRSDEDAYVMRIAIAITESTVTAPEAWGLEP